MYKYLVLLALCACMSDTPDVDVDVAQQELTVLGDPRAITLWMVERRFAETCTPATPSDQWPGAYICRQLAHSNTLDHAVVRTAGLQNSSAWAGDVYVCPQHMQPCYFEGTVRCNRAAACTWSF